MGNRSDEILKREILFSKDSLVLLKAMRSKIDRDRYKGTWEDLPNIKLVELLNLEVEELFKAIENEPIENVILECADVANFAMMIAGNAKRKLEERNEKNN